MSEAILRCLCEWEGDEGDARLNFDGRLLCPKCFRAVARTSHNSSMSDCETCIFLGMSIRQKPCLDCVGFNKWKGAGELIESLPDPWMLKGA